MPFKLRVAEQTRAEREGRVSGDALEATSRGRGGGGSAGRAAAAEGASAAEDGEERAAAEEDEEDEDEGAFRVHITPSLHEKTGCMQDMQCHARAIPRCAGSVHAV